MKKPEKPRSPGTKNEDSALWQKVAATVRPYAPKPPVKKTPATPVKMERTAVPPSKPVKVMADIGIKKMAAVTPKPAFDNGTEKNLRQKKWTIDKKIDLHGMRQHEAETALARFIQSALRAEKRTLLVITGKGNARTGGGVLRRSLPIWLSETDLRDHILAFAPAKSEDGGDGAFYIRLRKSKNRRL